MFCCCRQLRGICRLKAPDDFSISAMERLVAVHASTSAAAENDAPETMEREPEIDSANDGHCKDLRPDDGEIGATVKHILCEHHEVRRRADDLHEILQPHRHAFQRCRAPG